MPESWKECEGQVVDGQFPLVQHLGGSDHSVVFLTKRGKGTPQQAAIKFVPADAATAEAQLSRWKQAAQLSHPNLIGLFESGRCHLAGMDLLYVVMEHACENLAEFLPQRALSPAETRDMLEPFVDALSYLHGKGFVHGCIRPGNILASDDQLKLSSDSIRRVGENRIGNVKADAYTPPEFPAGASASSEPGDVWALGVTLVESLTQRVPESASSPSSDGQAVAVPETLPQPFLDIARHCLQSKPQQRWTIVDIAAKLNPKAATPAPPVAASAPSPARSVQSLPEATKPVAPQKSSVAVAEISSPAAAVKSAEAVDPLSVPLSTVEPLAAGAKRQAYDQQVITGKSSPARSYYLFVAVILALILGAIFEIPRLRNNQPESNPVADAPNRPVAASTTPSSSARVAPETPAKPQPKVEQKQTAPRANQPAPHSVLDSAQSLRLPTQAQPRSTTSSAKQSDSASSPTTSPTSLKSVIPRSDATAPAAPFVADREASIKAGSVAPGEVLNQVLPEVSEKSRSTIHGTVRTVIKVRVDSSGSVAAAEVASGGSKFFSTAALEAAKQWDFSPAKIDGHAVPSEWLLHFDFSQSDTKVTPLATKP